MARRRSKQVGALWKHAPKGEQKSAFLTGTIDLGVVGQLPIAVFKNDRKTKDNQPDYRIVISESANRQTDGEQRDL